jgi:hypothetical protein
MPYNDGLANPNDPTQLRNWGLGISAENSKRGLWDQWGATADAFKPFFQQQQQNYMGNMGGLLNSQVGQAQNQAGAYAAFKGLNPLSFTQSAGQGVRQKMTPGLFGGYNDLLSSQGQQQIGGAAQAGQFAGQQANEYARNLLSGSQQAAQTWEQPGFWDYLGGGLMSALPSIAGFALGGPLGGLLGGAVGGSLNGNGGSFGSGNYGV